MIEAFLEEWWDRNQKEISWEMNIHGGNRNKKPDKTFMKQYNKVRLGF